MSARSRGLRFLAGACGAAVFLAAVPVAAQITIDTRTGTVTNGTSGPVGTVDRRYAQIVPTHVQLSKTPLDAKTRQELIRLMQSEQGFAMRPFPKGHKGLTLNANGTLDPAGEGYLQMITAQGMCAKPGDRVVLTDVQVEHNKILFQINGGPDRKHRFLRHVEIGTGPMMGPVTQGDDPDPTGARLTLAFKGDVPDLTGDQVKQLLAPLIEFGVKTPVEAFTDTLPPKLKNAILGHQVLVGMSTDMVLFAKGQPNNKSREMDGQMPFEEWIYGKPPEDVEFVRINGNRVIRVEIAKIGKDPIIFTTDEVEGLMRTDGTPLEAKNTTRTVDSGDVERNADTQAPAPAPSLRNPGEKLPQDDDKDNSVGVMRPVQFPKQKQDDDSTQQPGSTQPGTTQPAATTAPASTNAPAATNSSQATPSAPPASTGAAPASGSTQPASGDTSQPAPAKPQQ
ncbi:MAG: hypothetical protein WBE76_16415 [Terracidiphilus sp.]